MGPTRFLFFACSILLSFCVTITGRAQEANYSIAHYTSKNGLPQNSITNMAIDKNGFLWMSTQDGICRYDGQGFRVYNMKNTPGIDFNRFSQVSLMLDGSILFYQNIDDNHVFRLQKDNSIVRDSTINLGKFLKNRRQTYALVGTLPKPASFIDIKEKTKLYTLDTHEAYQIDSGSISYFDTLSNKLVPLINVDAGFASSEILIKDFFLVQDGHHVKHIAIQPSITRVPFSKNRIYDWQHSEIVPDWQVWFPVPDQIVVFSNDNIYLFYNDGGKLKQKLLFTGFKLPPKWNQTITQVLFDQASKSLFIGSSIDGLYVLKQNQFNHFATNNPNHSIAVEIMLDNGEIVGEREHYDLHTKKMQPPHAFDVSSLYKDAEGSVYFTKTRTLYKADKQFEHYRPISFPSAEKQFMLAKSFLKDDVGRLWFCNTNSLAIITSDSLQFKLKHVFGPNNEISFLYQQAMDTFWILTRLDIYAYTPKDNILHRQPLLTDVIPRNAYKAKDGSSWVGTYGHGFYKYLNGKFTAMPLDNAGYLQNAHSFYEDNNGYFWIPTNNGLFQCRKSDLDAYAEGKLQQVYYYHYVSTDGFASDEFNGGFSPAYVYNNGEIVYPTMDGVVYFNPDSIRPTMANHPVFIDQVWVDGASMEPTAQLSLPPSFNQLKFKVESPFYANPENLVMEYNMEGLNNEWFPTKNGEQILFNKLPKGSYTLVIRKQQGFGNDNFAYKRFSFNVLPYWYETWWSRVLYLLLVVAVVAFLFSWRLKAAKRRAAIEAMLNEQQLKALRAQINPHFLQNTFEFLAQQMVTAPNETTIETMHQISAYLRHVLYRSDEAVVSLDEELKFIEEYLQVQQMLVGLNFMYEINTDDDIDVEYINVPSMLLQPVVENALKYGLDIHKEENLLRITITGDTDFVRCTVSDNGNGSRFLAKQADHQSKGLALTLERMKLLYKNCKGLPAVSSNINVRGGWDVVIDIPLH